MLINRSLTLHDDDPVVQAMHSEGRGIDIGAMMDRWTLQMGYPVVTISKNQSEQLPTHHIAVVQEHFLYGQHGRNNKRSVPLI